MTGAVALLGVATVLGDGDPAAALHGGLGRGDLLVLLGATSWVVYTTGAAGFPGWSPLRYTALSAASGGAVVVGIAVALSAAGVLTVPSGADVRAVAWQLTYVVVLAGNLLGRRARTVVDAAPAAPAAPVPPGGTACTALVDGPARS